MHELRPYKTWNTPKSQKKKVLKRHFSTTTVFTQNKTVLKIIGYVINKGEYDK